MYTGEYLEIFDSTKKIGHERPGVKGTDIGYVFVKLPKILELRSLYSDAN